MARACACSEEPPQQQQPLPAVPWLHASWAACPQDAEAADWQREEEGASVAQLQQAALAACARTHPHARRSAPCLMLSNRAATVRVLSESQRNSEQRCTKA